jgi:cysteine synthase
MIERLPAGTPRQEQLQDIARLRNSAGASPALRPGRGFIYDSITETIGDTPLLRLNRCPGGRVSRPRFWSNSNSSIEMQASRTVSGSTIDAMEASGVIRPQTAPAIQASRSWPRRGYRPILVTPDSMSIERHKMLTLLGAELMLTPATDAMKDAIARAEEIARTTGDTVIRQQFKNPANPRDSRAPRPRRSGRIWAGRRHICCRRRYRRA